MRKKLLSLVLALVMMLSMGTVAMAEETPASVDGSYTIANAAASGNTVIMKKAYTIENQGTVSPAETFVFTQTEDKKVYVSECENVGVDAYNDNGELKAYPITIADAVFDAVTANNDNNVTTNEFTITLPAYEAVGKYTYVFSENEGNTAGVTYDKNEYKVEVIVIDTAATGTEKQLEATVNVYVGGTTTKSDTISNTYKAGSLSVAKKVTGNMADKNKYFDVTVTFTKPENVVVNEAITYDTDSCGSYDGNDDGAVDYKDAAVATDAWEENTATVTIKLKDADTVKFNNIPYGVTYAVEEADYTAEGNGGYDEAKYTGTKITSETTDSPKNIEIDDAEQIVNIENNKEVEVATGINLDSMPYILILVAVAVGGVVIVSKKRKEEF